MGFTFFPMSYTVKEGDGRRWLLTQGEELGRDRARTWAQQEDA